MAFAHHQRPDPPTPESVRDSWIASLVRCAERGGLFVLICHAFITGADDARVAALESLIDAAHRDPRIAVRTIGEVADAIG